MSKDETIELPDWAKYTEEIYPLIDRYLETHVDKEVTRYLQISYGFFAFYTEKLREKVTKNEKHFANSSLFLNYMHDLLRSLITLHSARHMSPMAFVMRSILESRITFKYIFQDPDRRLDLYLRYEEVEKYTAFKEGRNQSMTPEEAAAIVQRCPEWIKVRGDGSEKITWNWTGDKDIKLPQMADIVGLKSDYDGCYSNASVFTHCSSVLRNSYFGKAGHSPIPVNDQTTLLALMGSMYGTHFLQEFYEAFGIPFPDEEAIKIAQMYLKFAKTYGGMSDAELYEGIEDEDGE